MVERSGTEDGTLWRRGALRVHQVRGDGLEACFQIRQVVFVQEQRVEPALEFDGLDAGCVQVLASLEGEPVGTGRLRMFAEQAKVERVAVLKAHRGTGVGRALMVALHEVARQRGVRQLMLHAQESAVPFYEGLAYLRQGERFMEADIPHFLMTRGL